MIVVLNIMLIQKANHVLHVRLLVLLVVNLVV